MGDDLNDVLAEVKGERAYQDKLWGGAANDDAQSEEDWGKYLNEYSQGTGRGEGRPFRLRMLKVAALAVAAIQAHDRKAAK